MKLITKAIERKLFANWTANASGENTTDFKPVLKLFTPWAGATWLLTERNPDNPDILYGLCDLGHGCPELGYVSLRELTSVVGPGGLRVERDMYFTANKTLSEYAEEASAEGSIIT